MLRLRQRRLGMKERYRACRKIRCTTGGWVLTVGAVELLSPALAGLVTGATLILAVGAQNAFVLRQGLSQRHVGLVVTICVVADVTLIGVGIAGLAGLVTAHPVLLLVIKWVGVAFLAAYGVLALLRARKPQSLVASEGELMSRSTVALRALAFTFLNPHVYLDTVLLLGSLANGHGPDGRWAFGIGAGVASAIWFVVIGYGSKLVAPVLASPRAWRVVEGLIGVVMLVLAVGLATSDLRAG